MNSICEQEHKYRTEVHCQNCKRAFLWGLSWDQSREQDFFCPECSDQNDKYEGEPRESDIFNHAPLE